MLFLIYRERGMPNNSSTNAVLSSIFGSMFYLGLVLHFANTVGFLFSLTLHFA